ncbi:MAG: hypothetical protein M3238_02350 [Actinomycetota bacterium]|nr:hypothetical protein [Actinomycetota bacterium]
MSDVLGWLGAALVLGAYGLVSLGKLPPSSRLWSTMNIVGAGALAWSATLDERWPFVVLNSVWLVIGVAALVRPPNGSQAAAPDRQTMPPNR